MKQPRAIGAQRAPDSNDSPDSSVALDSTRPRDNPAHRGGQVIDLEGRRIQRALAGDSAAFAALMRPHLAMMLRVASRTCRSPQLAEDAVQETLEIAARSLDRYEPGTSLKSWLAAITSQRAWTLLRSELRRKQREAEVVARPAAATPEQQVRGQQAAHRVQAALARLPEKRRRAATLRLDAGLSYKEIAAALDTSPASARVLVHLALKALRSELADLLEGGGHAP